MGEDQSRLPERGTTGEVRRGERRASDKAKERIHRLRRDKHVACLASTSTLAMTEEACREAEM